MAQVVQGSATRSLGGRDHHPPVTISDYQTKPTVLHTAPVIWNHSLTMPMLQILCIFENSQILKLGTILNFYSFILSLHVVNFLRLLHLVNVTSIQTDRLLKHHHVNRATAPLLTDRHTTSVC